MMDSEIARRFMWAVQALALPADEQVRLFPDFAEPADELALDHEQAQKPFLDDPSAAQLSHEQREAIAALDAQLERMSGPDHANSWTMSERSTSDRLGSRLEITAPEIARASA